MNLLGAWRWAPLGATFFAALLRSLSATFGRLSMNLLGAWRWVPLNESPRCLALGAAQRISSALGTGIPAGAAVRASGRAGGQASGRRHAPIGTMGHEYVSGSRFRGMGYEHLKAHRYVSADRRMVRSIKKVGWPRHGTPHGRDVGCTRAVPGASDR